MTLYNRETGKSTQSQIGRNRFASVSSNIESIAQKFHADDELVKLLVRNSIDLEEKGKVTNKERVEALTESIITIPKINKESDLHTYLIMQPIQGVPFKDGMGTRLMIAFDIICNFDVWKLKGGESRPMSIMNRIDSLLGDTKLDTFGKFEFLGFNAVLIDEQHAGYHMEYIFGQE